jgi:Transposase DDE domain
MPRIAKQARFSVRNWREYNESLVARGSITLWFSDEALEHWYHDNSEGKRGRPFIYSDSTMETFLTIRELLRLPYRQTEGFVRSILSLVAEGLSAPDFTSAAKRAAKLGVRLPILPRRGRVDVVLDSTGLKVFGEGEWKVRQHGPSKRRTWRKLHLAVDPQTQEIVAEVLTTNAGHDADQAETLLEDVPGKINTVTADGAYDQWKVYGAIDNRRARPRIPPRHDAKIKRHANTAGPRLPRDEAIRMIRRVGRKNWKKRIGYHCRSLVETAVSRLKTIFGPVLKNRTFPNQITEARLRCKILNHFNLSRLAYAHPN